MGVVSNLSKNHELVLTGAFVWKMRDIAMMINDDSFHKEIDPIPKHQAPIETNHKKLQHLPLRVAQNHDAKHLSDQPQLNDTVDG